MIRKRINTNRQPRTTLRQRPKKAVKTGSIDPLASEPAKVEADYSYLDEDLYQDDNDDDGPKQA